MNKKIVMIFLSLFFCLLVFENLYLRAKLMEPDEVCPAKEIVNEPLFQTFDRKYVECNFYSNSLPISKQMVDISEEDNKVCINNVMLVHTKGTSMDPNLGRSVMYTKYNGEQLYPGDIISFSKNNGKAIHRIIEVDKDFVITKGDNNMMSDYNVNKDSINGIVKCTCFD